ncbi:MAG TPA: hypothetical protein VGD95_03670 [Micavibrio sp.]
MWIFLWFVASAFILGVFGWSLVILQQQKRAWSSFAQKHNLSYVPGKVVDAPAMKGAIYGYQVAFFPDYQATQDVRNQRLITTLEFDLGAPVYVRGIVSTADYAGFVAEQDLNGSFEIDYPGWDKTRIVRSNQIERFQKYLTADRLEFLHSIMTMKNSTALIYCDDDRVVLHIETTDPIRNAERFEKIVQKITSSFARMKLTEEERAAFTSAA